MYWTKPLATITPLQRRVLQAVWRGFRTDDGWATFGHLDAELRAKGIESAAAIVDDLFPHFVNFRRHAGPPFADAEVGLTIRGLHATKRKGAAELAEIAAEVVGSLAARRRKIKLGRKATSEPTVSVDDLRVDPGIGPIEARRLWWLLPHEHPIGGLSGSMDAWYVTLTDRLDQYRGASTVEGFLEADERRIKSAIALEKRDPVLSNIATPGQQSDQEEVEVAVVDRTKVFVVSGRDHRVNEAMFVYLTALGLHPLEWSELLAATQKGAPYVGEVLERGFAEAQAVVVLMTPDDMVQLRPELVNEHDEPDEKSVMAQPRPNVLFEAGMAFGAHPDRTILVTFARTRRVTDVIGRHEVRFDGGADARQELAQRLRNANCDVNTTGKRWLRAGDFPSFDWNDPLGTSQVTAAREEPAEDENVALVLGAMAQFQDLKAISDRYLREVTALNRDDFDFAVEQIEKRRLASVHRGGGMRVRFEITKETRRWWSEHPEQTAIDSAVVETAAWMPRSKSFVLRFRDNASLDVDTEPTFGELVWLKIRGHEVGVKSEGMELSDAHRYLPLMEDVWDAMERGGEHAAVGQRFRFSPPVRVPT